MFKCPKKKKELLVLVNIKLINYFSQTDAKYVFVYLYIFIFCKNWNLHFLLILILILLLILYSNIKCICSLIGLTNCSSYLTI